MTEQEIPEGLQPDDTDTTPPLESDVPVALPDDSLTTPSHTREVRDDATPKPGDVEELVTRDMAEVAPADSDDPDSPDDDSDAKPEAQRWEPPLTNAPSGTVATAERGITQAQKSHDDAIRTHAQLQREPEPPKCYITGSGDNWAWAYAGQGADNFATKEAAVGDARSNLVPLLDGNGEPLKVIYEVVQP